MLKVNYFLQYRLQQLAQTARASARLFRPTGGAVSEPGPAAVAPVRRVY